KPLLLRAVSGEQSPEVRKVLLDGLHSRGIGRKHRGVPGKLVAAHSGFLVQNQLLQVDDAVCDQVGAVQIIYGVGEAPELRDKEDCKQQKQQDGNVDSLA